MLVTESTVDTISVDTLTPHEQAIIDAATAILTAKMRAKGSTMDSPSAARQLACLHMGHLEHEAFAVMFLDAQNRLIEFRQLFRGTLTQTSVYPREVVRTALALGAAAAILVHNHPSGHCEPSRADEHLTHTLKAALALVDVRTLDHLIVAGAQCASFAERGLI